MPSLIDLRRRANTKVNIRQDHSILCSSAWIITGRKSTAIFIKYQSFRKKIDGLPKSKLSIAPISIGSIFTPDRDSFNDVKITILAGFCYPP